VTLCALVAFIALQGSASFGQMPPAGPMPWPGAANPPPPGVGSPQPPLAPGPVSALPPPLVAGPAVPQEEVVAEVRIVGNRTVSLDKILPKIRTRAGRPYIEEQVAQDVRDLFKMGVFVGVKTLIQHVPTGVIVTFQMAERPLLQEVIIVGNDTFLTSALRKEADLKAGDAADPFAVESGRRKIEDYYKSKGFSKVRVTVMEGNKAGDLRAIFIVDEGPKQKVFWVNFVGNTFVSSARLKKIIDTSPPWFYLFSGEVDRKQIDEDVKKLEAYYRDFGYFYAKVGRELEFNEKQNWLTVTFVIVEGPRYQVQNIVFLGNQKIDTTRLAAKIKLQAGQFFDKNQQNLDLQKIRDEYGGQGYVFSKIEAEERMWDQPGKMDVVYNIVEGARYRVGRINIEIKGDNPHTQIMTVLNRLSFKPGDIVDTREFAASERRLKAAQLYKVEPQKGVEPKIVYSPPNSEVTADAGQRRTTYYRVPGGEAPLPPDERYLDLGIAADSLQGESNLVNARYAAAAYPQPVFPNRTFQTATYANQAAAGQTYAQPPGQPQPPQTYDRIPASNAPNGPWPQPQPQQWQNWAPAASGYGLPYGGQPPQNGNPAAAQTPQWRTTNYRAPGDGYADSDGAMPPSVPQNAQFPQPVYPQPTYQGQTYQPTYPNQVSGPPYLPPPQPQAASNVVPMQAGYQPGDAGPQWQPQQQPPQGYPGQQPPAYYYNPQPAPAQYANPPAGPPTNYYPPNGGAPAAPPSGYAANSGYAGPPSNPGYPQYAAPNPNPNYGPPPGNSAYGNPGPPANAGPPGGQGIYSPSGPAAQPGPQAAAAGDLYNNPIPSVVPSATGDPLVDLPIRISPEETQTGRLMFGVGVNSDAGLVGNITVDEQNFDWRQFPTSWDDIVNGRAFRGAGEKFRLELVPGTQVQRYSVSFTEPYLNDRPVSLGLSGYYYERIYPEWTETRVGGGVTLGYQFTHDLTGSIKFLGQNVDIKNPEYPVPSLEDVVGHNPLFTTSVALQHDTRDSPFLATEGHLFSATFDETVGAFQYPRAMLEWSQFFRIFERADRSGKHVLSLSMKGGYTGPDTPIFERYYDGGFSSIRGFAFRGVTPRDPVYHMGEGGDFTMTATAQYLFPITADDMLKGVMFIDAGTVEPTISDWVDKVRVAPGLGLRISIPAMGPAPIALDFAIPIVQQNGDQQQIFSFFIGYFH
jgi:outer membrane protein insertion porin family